MVDRTGQQVGNYRLIGLVDKGGSAEVYLGEHLALRRKAAIKLLHAALSEQQREEFLSESQKLVELTHPHIVRMLDFGIEKDMPYLIMDYAPYGTLRRRHPKGSRLPPTTIVPYVRQVASALQYTHEQKLVHRDVKPENMLLGTDQEVLLSDFGIATIAHTSSSLEEQKDIGGTVPYMAPEQLRGMPRPASDQYALAIVVYEWLSGELPFHGSITETATRHLLTPPPSLHEKDPTISQSLEQVVFTALAKDPHQRYASVEEFADALENVILGEQPTINLADETEINSAPEMMSASSDQPTSIVTVSDQPTEVPTSVATAPDPSSLATTPLPSSDAVVHDGLHDAPLPHVQPPPQRGHMRSIGLLLLTLLIVGVVIATVAMHGQPSRPVPTPIATVQHRGAQHTPAPTPTAAGLPANVLAQDTFQRANQPFWGTASDGQIWGDDANAQPAFSIVDGHGQIANGNGTLTAAIKPSATDSEVLITASMNHFGNGVNFGAVLRSTSADNLYKALLDGTTLTIIKRVNGQNTTIASTPFQTQDGAAYVLDFQAIGTALSARAWLSGANPPAQWMLSVNDQALTQGQGGVRVVEVNTSVVTVTSFVERVPNTG